MLKAEKRSVDYSRGHRGSHCGPPTGAADLGACEKVSGAISRVYWCRLWSRAQSK